MSKRVIYGILIALLPACTLGSDKQAEETLTEVQNLAGPDEVDEPATMLMRFWFDPGMRGSATLVAPNVVLTNAHAAFGQPQDMYLQNATYTSPGVDAIQPIDKMQHPSHVAATDPYDLALLRLGCAILGVRPAEVNSAPLETSMTFGDPVKLVGFGPTSAHTGNDWGTKRSFNTTMQTPAPHSFTAWASIYRGDSGGSAYGWPSPQHNDGDEPPAPESGTSAVYPQRKLIGVITTTGAGVLRVDPHSQWIHSTIAQWADPSLAPMPSTRTINETSAPNVCPLSSTVGHYSIQSPEPNTTYHWSASNGATITSNGTTATLSTSWNAPITLTVTAEGAGGCQRTFSETIEPTQNNCDTN